MAVTYSIKTAAIESGVSAHTIRAWERRYGVLDPQRTASNRRAYSESDVARLKLLGLAVRAGHSIGNIALMTDTDLQTIASASARVETKSYENALEFAKQAVLNLDSYRLDEILERGSAALGLQALVDEVLTPLLHFLDYGWDKGEVSIAMEHTASATIRTFLGRSLRRFAASPIAPMVVVTTPSRQLHELGALIVALLASLAGCRVAYLGPNMPAIEISNAAIKLGASVVALSIVHPEDDELLSPELALLRSRLPIRIAVWVGGRAAPHYQSRSTDVGIAYLPDLDEFRAALASLV